MSEVIYFDNPNRPPLVFDTPEKKQEYLASILFYKGESSYDYYRSRTTDNPPLSEEEFRQLQAKYPQVIQEAKDATTAAMNFIEEHEEYFEGFNLRITIAEEKINNLLEEPDDVQQFPSYLNFPNLGKNNVLYIDDQENESYRWDNDSLKYYKINEIEIINGGN